VRELSILSINILALLSMNWGYLIINQFNFWVKNVLILSLINYQTHYMLCANIFSCVKVNKKKKNFCGHKSKFIHIF